MKSETASVSVVILNYNGLAYLKDCLTSLEKQTYPNTKVILCDNASKDGSVEFVRKNFPKVHLIVNSENFGFAEGNNIAINYALAQGTDYIFLLNNDTVIEPDAIGKLLQTAQSDNQIGIIGSEVLDLKNRSCVQELGMYIDRFGYPTPAKEPFKQDISEVFFVSGCAMLIKRTVLQRIGGFDSRYFMFAEDLDLCWRAQLSGYMVVANKSSKIYHAGGGSITGGVAKKDSYSTDVRRIFFRERNTIRTLIKNYDRANMLKIVSAYFLLLAFESAFWFIILKPATGKNIINAILWNLKILPDTLKQRVIVQNLRKVPDQKIMEKMVSGYQKLRDFRTVGIPKFK